MDQHHPRQRPRPARPTSPRRPARVPNTARTGTRPAPKADEPKQLPAAPTGPPGPPARYAGLFDAAPAGLRSRTPTESPGRIDLAGAAQAWQATFDAVADAVMLLDAEMHIRRWNRAAAALFPKGLGPLGPRTCCEVLQSREPVAGRCSCFRAQRARRRESSEVRIGDRWYRITVDPLVDPQGRFCGAIHITRDITEGRRTEEHLRAAAVELERRVSERTARLNTLNEQLRREVQQRRLLEGRLLDVAEREQRRIGQDLHDDVCSQLTGIEFLFHALARDLAGCPRDLAGRARKIGRMLQHVMADARELAQGLSPLALDAHGLILGLQHLARRTRNVYQCRCSFRGDPVLTVADPAKALHLYRIAQEAVTNAVRHGRAPSVTLSLTAHDGHLELRIRDTGRGLPAHRSLRRGLGLLTMNSRAAAIGGTLVVQTNRRGGTDVLCRMPASTRPTAGSPPPKRAP